MSKSILGRTQLNIGTLNLTEIVADKLEANTAIKGDYLTPSRGLATNSNRKIVSTTTTSAEIDFLTGATSNIQTQLNAKQPTVNLTANRALISNGSGGLAVSDITNTELSRLDGVSSNIQTQITANASAITSANSAIATNTTAISANATAIAGKEPTVSLTANRALISSGSGTLAVSGITNTELSRLNNVSSNIQNQLNGKQPEIDSSNRLDVILCGIGNVDNESFVQLSGADLLSDTIKNILTTPSSKLIQAGTNLTYNNSTTPPTLNATDTNEWVKNGNVISYTAGQVGIGDAGATDRALTVRRNGLTQTLQLWVSNLGGQSGDRNMSLKTPDADDANAPFEFQTSNSLLFVIDNTEALLINSGGNVIVNTVFQNKINLNANAEIGRGLFGYSGNNNHMGIQHNALSVNGNNYAIRQNASGRTKVNSPTGQKLGLAINNSEKLTISSSGLVGIGTTDPRSALHVQGSMNANSLGVHIGQQGTSSAIEIVAGDTDSAFIDFTKVSADKRGRIIYSLANDSMSIETANAERIRIDGNGKVGIGTTNPSSSFTTTINDAGTGDGRESQGGALLIASGVAGATNTLNIVMGVNTTNEFAYIQSIKNNVGFKNLLLNPRGGNVGIGISATPAELLHVNGVCRASSFTTTSDDRVKHFETPTTDCLTKIMSLKPTTYQKSNELYDASFVLADDKSNLKEGDELRLEVGFIAQEVKASIYEEFSSSVGGGDSSDNVVVEEEQEYTLNYNNIFVVAVGAIQELKAEINTLKERIAILEQ